MRRHAAGVVAVVLAAAVAAVAAPVPKSKESAEQKLKRVFGEKTEPEGTTVKLEGDTLRISVPALPTGKAGQQTEVPISPRTALEVDGDFTLTVKVRMPVPADNADVNTWAGVYLMSTEKEYVEYERYFDHTNGKADWRGWGQVVTNGGQNATFSNPLKPKGNPADTAVLRLVREGGTVTMHTDIGDGEWGGQAVANMPLPDTVTVGVYLGGRKGPHTAEFENLTLVRPAAEKAAK